MSETIDNVKGAVRAFLHAHGQPVPAKTATSKKEHLEVWLIGARRRAVGLEMDHDGLVNLWITRMNLPPNLPESIIATHKEPKGSKWTDGTGKGANSNLSSYDDFRGKKITRLGCSSTSETRLILDHLNR